MLPVDLTDYNVILASASPRRQQLLADAGIHFTVTSVSEVDESYPDHLQRSEITEYLARKKSEAYTKPLLKNDILITADTIVCQGDEVLLKPVSHSDAVAILKKIANNTHTVYTGVHIRSAERSTGFVSQTEVKFDHLSEDEINYYVDNYRPYDKAGAYGIQEWIGFVGVEEIHGSYFNVMGLPIHRLYRELERFLNK